MRLLGANVAVLAVAAVASISTTGCKEKKQRRQVEGIAASDIEPAPPAVAPPVIPSGPRGTIRGVVKLSGAAPEMPLINNGSDPVCAQRKLRAETILRNQDGTLNNVVVRVKPGSVPAQKPDAPVVVKQHECRYVPRVQGAVAGQELLVYNGDETSHNVHVRAAEIGDRQGAEALWNRQQPKKSAGLPPIKSVVENRPVLRLKCDQHGWMSGFLVISDNPFFTVTGENGFSLVVPAGDVVLQTWHEFYGLKEIKVTVAEGQTETIDFGYDAIADNPTLDSATKAAAKATN